MRRTRSREGLTFDAQQMRTVAVSAKNTMTRVAQHTHHSRYSGLSTQAAARSRTRRRSLRRRSV
eukprot:2596729-Prorocentrum_lima.AAC.1